MKELKKQTIKYFIRNKLLELGGLIILIFGITQLGKIFGCWGETCNSLMYFGQGVIILIGIVLALFIIGLFLGENWSLAKKQAKRKTRNKKELRKLTIKYFIRNIVIEIVIGIVLCYIETIGAIFGCWNGEVCTIGEYFTQGWFTSLICGAVMVGVWKLIKANWNWAKKQAKRKLKK